ncbi:SusC/RagA family TonB-linked outer membrane protein [Chitinophaga filiformis]|uniref:TonB-dependent receptor n=1 Tax=Chitinophaga filiformis TaxID=104663 RepID=A0ABY4IC66_CHIFI|nr:TonB-dependent receptor [Chitinophaga filiformis]UPK72256.1 TonB-dependent receptor [Chitinophaga filiformis]
MLVAAKTSGQDIRETTISMGLSGKSLETALKEIEQKTSFRFGYRKAEVSRFTHLQLPASTRTVASTLDLLLSGTGLTYQQKDHYIFIIPVIPVPVPEKTPQLLQELVVTGTVTSAKGEKLPGVSIRLKGAANGTNTDQEGKFSIRVADEQSTLVFSFIGYNTKEVPVAGRATINVQLEENTTALGEIIVVGYGTQLKATSIAAVSAVKGKDFAQKPVVNMTNNLVGRMPGLIADQGSGEPGLDGSRIRIRGTSTLGNANPLLVVDGIYRDFSRLDPATIESITILKDAAAVAPYGLAGANGVILVTTKKGKTGAPVLSYNGYAGFQNPTRMPRMVNSYQYALLANEANRNDNFALSFTDAQIAGYKKTVDGAADADRDRYPNSRGLRDVIQRNAILTNHNLQLSGGTEKVKYFAALGYTSQEGQFSTTNLKKYNALANLDIEATKYTRVSLSLSGWVEDQTYSGYSDPGSGDPNNRYASAGGGIMYQAFRTPPTSAIYYSNGLWGSYITNSLVGTIAHSGYSRNENTQIMTTFSIEQQLPFIKGLSIKGVASYDPYNTYSKTWKTPILTYSADFTTTPYTFNPTYIGPSKPTLNLGTSQNKSFTYQGYLNYHNTFGKNDVTFLGVLESRTQKYWDLSGGRINYPIDIDELDRGGTAQGELSNGGSSSQQRQIGYVYRLSYNYDGKYLAEVSGRYDGHYYFAPGHKYGFFPAYSLGWNMARENFMKDNVTWVDALKLRASYGESGNLAGGPFQYLTGYSIYNNAAVLDGKLTAGISEVLQANTSITWERAKKSDVGIDASLWKGKLTVTADYFYEKRSNMLVPPTVTVPAEYGVGLTEQNAAVMSNHGFEIAVGTTHTFTNGLRLDLNGNFTYAQNKLLQVFETDATYNNPNRRQTGRSNGTQFGLKALGYFTPADFNSDGSLKTGVASIPDAPVHPGDLKYADLSGPSGKPDGIIDDNDQTVIGRPNGTPQMIFGLSPALSWKGFDLNLLLQAATQISLPVGGNLVFPFDQQGSASELYYNDHWTPANTNALYPRVSTQPKDYNTRFSSWWVRDASYIKLRSAELGYSLPSRLTKRVGIQQLRVYAAGQNLWTWTPHMKEKIDPEARSSNGQYYFQQQTTSVGLNVTF